MGPLLSKLYLNTLAALGVNPGQAISEAIDTNAQDTVEQALQEDPARANALIHWRDPRQPVKQQWGLPLTYAIAIGCGPEIAKTLLKHGADMDPDTLKAAYLRLVREVGANARRVRLRTENLGLDEEEAMRDLYELPETAAVRAIIGILTQQGAPWEAIGGDLSVNLLGDVRAMLGYRQARELGLADFPLTPIGSTPATAMVQRLAAANLDTRLGEP